jgi:prepilin-type processing-associated H-X9-DG protein
MSTDPQPRTSRAAVLSLVLGLLSPVLSLAAAIPAWVLGLRALRAINASDGRLRGARLAAAGLILGIAATVVTAAGLVVLVLLHLNAGRDRAECANNLRQIGLAVNVYYDQNKQLFPPATVVATDLPPEKRMSWFVSVLPFVERKQSARAWLPLVGQVFDPAVAWDRPPNESAAHLRLAAFLCPAALHRNPPAPDGVTTYVGLAGVDPDAALLPKTSPRAGFFGYDRVISRDDVRAGASYTTMAAETDRALGPWVAGGPPTDRGLDPEETAYVGTGRPFGGLHSGGANVLWVDASVRFAPDSIPPERFRLLATLADRGE